MLDKVLLFVAIWFFTGCINAYAAFREDGEDRWISFIAAYAFPLGVLIVVCHALWTMCTEDTEEQLAKRRAKGLRK